MGRGRSSDAMKYKPVKTTEDFEYQLLMRRKKRACCSICCKASLVTVLVILAIGATSALVAYYAYPQQFSVLVKVIRAEVKETGEKFFPFSVGKASNGTDAEVTLASDNSSSSTGHGGEDDTNADGVNATEPISLTILMANGENATELGKTHGGKGSRRLEPLSLTRSKSHEDPKATHANGKKSAKTETNATRNSVDVNATAVSGHDGHDHVEVSHDVEVYKTFRPWTAKLSEFVSSGAALVVAAMVCVICLSVTTYFAMMGYRRRRRLRRLERLSEELRNESNRFLVQAGDSDDESDDQLSPKACVRKERVN